MEKLKKLVATYVLIFTGLFLFLFMVVGLSVAIKNKGLGSSDAAGWVQAIGVAFAIGATFGVAVYQRASEQRASLEMQIKSNAISSAICYELANDACRAIRTATAKIVSHPAGTKFTFSTERLEGVQTGLHNVINREMATEFYRPMLRLQTQVTYCLVAIRRKQGRVRSVSSSNIDSAHDRVAAALSTRDHLKQLYLKFNADVRE